MSGVLGELGRECEGWRRRRRSSSGEMRVRGSAEWDGGRRGGGEIFAVGALQNVGYRGIIVCLGREVKILSFAKCILVVYSKRVQSLGLRDPKRTPNPASAIV